MKPHAYLLGFRGVWNLVALSLMAGIRYSLLALLARVALAITFWVPVSAAVDGMVAIKQSSCEQLPLIQHALATPRITYAEHVFLLLLLLGLLTRFSATALLCITLTTHVILSPAAWPSHLGYAVLLLLLIGRGAGRVSFDHALGLH